jgi:hypothetical protein
MFSKTIAEPSEATTRQNGVKKTLGVYVLTAMSVVARLFGGEGAFGWLVWFQKDLDNQPRPQNPQEHWPFFFGLLSSANKHESVHCHVWSTELYHVDEGRLFLHTWEESEWVLTILGPHDSAAIEPLVWHYVEWDETAGPAWGICVKAPHDPSVPGAKIVAPTILPSTQNGNGYTSAS